MKSVTVVKQYDTLWNEYYIEGKFCYSCNSLSFVVFPSEHREHHFNPLAYYFL